DLVVYTPVHDGSERAVRRGRRRREKFRNHWIENGAPAPTGQWCRAGHGPDVLAVRVVCIVLGEHLAGREPTGHLHLGEAGLALHEHAQLGGCRLVQPRAVSPHVDEEIGRAKDVLDVGPLETVVTTAGIDITPAATQSETAVE